MLPLAQSRDRRGIARVAHQVEPAKPLHGHDLPRAKDALARAEAALQNGDLSKEDRRLREAAKRRAQVRISAAESVHS